MRSSRLASLVLLAGAVTAGLVLEAAEDPATKPPPVGVVAGVVMPAAPPRSTLTSTWYCAGGTATKGGVADHVLLIANPTDQPRRATVTVLPGVIAPSPSVVPDASGATTTIADETTTTEVEAPVEPTVVTVPKQTRVDIALKDLVDAPLAGAIVEIDGGEVAVEHQVTGDGGRATAPCSTTAAREWSFPWGVTLRGSRELLVFMNPFPDDATVNIDFATDEGTRETLRFQNFVVKARSVVGAYIDEDVLRQAQVSAQVHVGSGRLVVDRIQIFDGTEPTVKGITLGLGAPAAAAVWVFPDGKVDEGITEQVVVFNPSDAVAEVEVEARLEDPASVDIPPEPFELTVAPHRFAIVNIHEPDGGAGADAPTRVPKGVGHSLLVRSLNGVPVTAERVVSSSEPNSTLGISATLGAPLAAPKWFFAGGGVTKERDEYLTVFNGSPTKPARVRVTALVGRGGTLAVEGLQRLDIPAGGRLVIHLSEHVGNRESLPLVVEADGPVIVERGLYRIAGRGMSLSMGIPLAVGVEILDPLES